MEDLQNKTLVMLIGPSAVGKSALMKEVARLDSRFGRVKSFTTRPRRGDDESGQYLYLSPSEFSIQTESGEVITDIEFPTTGYHYGTVLDSYLYEYNLLDTLANSVTEYRALPFQRTVAISLTTEPGEWEGWLARRYADGGDEIQQRLQEARMSIMWSLAQREDHHWLINKPDQLHEAAAQLIQIVDGALTSTDVPQEAHSMFAHAETLLSYQ